MKIIKTIKNLRLIYKNAGILQICADIFNFVETTHKEKKPMVCKIAFVQKGSGKHYFDFVSLWAGVGDVNPIERAKHLKAQNIELIRLLNIAKEGNLTEEDKQLIELTIKTFE